MFYIIPIRKEQYINNLKIAFPNEEGTWYNSLAKRGYKFFMEQFIQLFAMPKSINVKKIKIIGQELLESTFKKNKGIIFVSGHIGAWEVLSYWVSTNNYPTTLVAAKQKNRGSDKFFIELRGKFGMKHIYRRSPIDDMYDILNNNGALALASDQDARKRGVFVNFFNKKASTPTGAARFYLNNDSPILFAICYKTKKNDYVIEFKSVKTNQKSTIESITQSYTSILEEYIRNYPEQYFWFHRRWKTQPSN